MDLPAPLHQARLIRRYKRFLADVDLNGETVVAHCPNPGSMMGLAEPGMAVWLADATSRTAKLKYGWVLTEVPGPRPVLVGINAGRANAIAEEALRAGLITELTGYETVRREVPYGTNSRVDFVLEGPDRPPAYVEVKNVHLLREEGLAEFPDSVTARGAKHLRELSAVAIGGARAVMLYIVQRPDANHFRLARDIDPAYAAAFTDALSAGVEALCYDCTVTTGAVSVNRPLPIIG